MDQTLALEIMSEGNNVLLTGPAGSGKTYVLNEFIRRSKGEGKFVSVTATTGLAATHVGGATIHAWSGMGIHDELPRGFADNLAKGRRDIIVATDVLIIDEISMLHDFRLDLVDQIAKTVRRSEEPFGGMQVILCGDFFQLPPVSRRDEFGNQPSSNFVVSAEVWEAMDPTICYLEEQHRQNDEKYLEILNALRANEIRRHHAETLLERQNADLNGEVTELHTTNVDVDRINESRLARLPGKSHYYPMQTTGSANYVESLKRSCLAPEVLELKIGALVMFIKNSTDKKYANGSLGTVIGFDKTTGYPEVQLKSGRIITPAPDSWELRDGEKKRAGLVQLPLRLAWAITVHKSQGMTLDAAKIDLRRAFVEGMGYVALSRVKSLDTLSLDGLNQMALRVSPAALEIDRDLRRRSSKAAQDYEHLRERAEQRKHAPAPKPPKTGDWHSKIDKMRQTYPNAFRPWAEADDKKLLKLFTTGKPVNLDELTKTFGRHPGSIRARLKKHFGEDAVI